MFSGIKRFFRFRQYFSRCYLRFFRPESDCAAGTVFVPCLIIVVVKHAVLNVKPLAGENCAAGCRVIALESAVDNMGYGNIRTGNVNPTAHFIIIPRHIGMIFRLLKIKRAAPAGIIFFLLRSFWLIFINSVAGKRAVNNLADITALCRSDRSAGIVVDVVLENAAGNLFCQTVVDKAVLIIFENRTNGADLAIVSNDAVVVRKRAFDIADCSFIENQGIFSVYVYLDVVNGLPAAVLYLFRPFRDVFCR